MTRKDYQLIASGFLDAVLRCKDPARRWGIYDGAAAVAARLERDNVRFDRDKFLAACGFPKEE